MSVTAKRLFSSVAVVTALAIASPTLASPQNVLVPNAPCVPPGPTPQLALLNIPVRSAYLVFSSDSPNIVGEVELRPSGPGTAVAAPLSPYGGDMLNAAFQAYTPHLTKHVKYAVIVNLTQYPNLMPSCRKHFEGVSLGTIQT